MSIDECMTDITSPDFRIGEALSDIIMEYHRARDKWSPFNSPHEGFAILLEELDELKEHVWRKPDDRDREAMRNEAIQVGAMALRFILDVCDKDFDR